MKKILTIAALAAAGFAVWRKVSEDREIRQQWEEVTDPLPE